MKQFIFCLFLLSGLTAQCQRKCISQELFNNYLKEHPEARTKRLNFEKSLQGNVSRLEMDNAFKITVPVVVHVLYHDQSMNISDSQILSQIKALNSDFKGLNADSTQIPSAFQPLFGKMNIQFKLATTDPQGNPTNGITRTKTSVLNFDGSQNLMKHSGPYGGTDAWDTQNYLNIWVCNLQDNILGVSQFPDGGMPSNDGIIVNYRCFGTTGDLLPRFNLGRTLVHEAGHWLNLYHIWGDTEWGDCKDTDFVEDTPNQFFQTNGKPKFPQMDACTTQEPGIMFMNYMDYVDDNHMLMFSAGQVERMKATFTSGMRPGFKENGPRLTANSTTVIIYPNPVNQDLFITGNIFGKITVKLADLSGRLLMNEEYLNPDGEDISVDLSSFPPGLYVMNVSSDFINETRKLIVNPR